MKKRCKEFILAVLVVVMLFGCSTTKSEIKPQIIGGNEYVLLEEQIQDRIEELDFYIEYGEYVAQESRDDYNWYDMEINNWILAYMDGNCFEIIDNVEGYQSWNPQQLSFAERKIYLIEVVDLIPIFNQEKYDLMVQEKGTNRYAYEVDASEYHDFIESYHVYIVYHEDWYIDELRNDPDWRYKTYSYVYEMGSGAFVGMTFPSDEVIASYQYEDTRKRMTEIKEEWSQYPLLITGQTVIINQVDITERVKEYVETHRVETTEELYKMANEILNRELRDQFDLSWYNTEDD
jgi:hypothetical protein